MRYGERLKFAREHRKLTQVKLSEVSSVSQPLISQLERSETATGSEYTNRLAKALAINAEWLADGVGEMIEKDVISEPARHILNRLSTMTEREQYRVVRMVDAFAEDATPNECDGNGHCGERKA